jgi:glucose-1-phosphate thymidylyltransferase
MKLIILAAGYATRLYPLTLTQSKSLLPVADKPILEYVLDNLAGIDGLDQVYIVTNSKFAAQFQTWADGYRFQDKRLRFTLVDDGSDSEETKLGALGDLHLVLKREAVQDDIIVVAADNLFSERLDAFGAYCREVQAPVLAIYDVGDLERIRKYNALALGPEGQIAFFEEKPQHPKSTLTGIALYYYPRAVIPMIYQYIAEGNNPDQPGRLIQWLFPRLPVFTWRVPGLWFDIGSHETLAEADRIFRARKLKPSGRD